MNRIYTDNLQKSRGHLGFHSYFHFFAARRVAQISICGICRAGIHAQIRRVEAIGMDNRSRSMRHFCHVAVFPKLCGCCQRAGVCCLAQSSHHHQVTPKINCQPHKRQHSHQRKGNNQCHLTTGSKFSPHHSLLRGQELAWALPKPAASRHRCKFLSDQAKTPESRVASNVGDSGKTLPQSPALCWALRDQS